MSRLERWIRGWLGYIGELIIQRMELEAQLEKGLLKDRGHGSGWVK